MLREEVVDERLVAQPSPSSLTPDRVEDLGVDPNLRSVGRAAAPRGPPLRRLTAYRWPGNVRELEAVLEEAMILKARGWLRPENLTLDAVPEGPAVAIGPRREW